MVTIDKTRLTDPGEGIRLTEGEAAGMLDRIREFASEIERDYPGHMRDFEEFPSGAAHLEVTADPEIWVMEYVPSLRILGVSRMSTATFGWEGVENSFADFQGVKKFVLDLLQDQSGGRTRELAR